MFSKMTAKWNRRNHLFIFTILATVMVSAVWIRCDGDMLDEAERGITLKLLYDDRYSFHKAITDIETLEVNSFQTGTQALDVQVIKTSEDDKMKVIAKGCGRAKITFEDETNLSTENKVVQNKSSVILKE